jgi:Fur family transcriptional regulator, ferric uptake regulator
MSRKARISAAILAMLGDSERHAWTLDELHDGLVQRGLDSDFSSVFRAAEKLLASGMIRKIVFDDGRARLELVATHHDHLHCMRCDTVVPVPCLIGHGEIVALERETGAAITDHHLVLNGICGNCRAAADVDGSDR